MAMTVASRYAVLSLDEDDDYSNRKKKGPGKKPPELKSQNAASIKSDTNLKNKRKGSLQNQNVKNKNKLAVCENMKNQKDASDDQWEEWKLKDAQFVEGNYEDELSKAILLSKLEYEEQKHLFETVKKGDENKKNSKKNKKNQKFAKNEQNDGSKLNKDNTPIKYPGKGNLKIQDESNKFKSSKADEGTKGQGNNKGGRRELVTGEALARAQYEDSLEKKDKEITELKEEVEKLKNELVNAKSKNKKLCQIISKSETKDKMEVLLEFERLQTVKDELSSEVVSLHAQLEQERSKVRALSGNDHKSRDKNKKKNVISTESPP